MTDAKDIFDLATELEGTFGQQRALDTLVLSQYLQRHIIEAPKPKGKQNIIPIKPIGAGFAARVANEDISFLSAPFFLRVNAAKADQEKKASELEAAFVGGLALAAEPGTYIKGIKDLSLFGRCWWNVYANPKAWAGRDFDREEDESEEEFIARIEAMKRDRFPIIWRNIEARNTWRTVKGNGDLDQVVEIRSMTRRQIEHAYGPGVVTESPSKKYGNREELKVIEYADDKECKTVVCSGSPNIAYEFTHELGCNPYVMAEMPPPPPNEYGIFWTGSTFDLRHIIEEIDGRLSDINWNIRQATRGGKVAYISPELRASDPETVGTPPEIKIEPDGLTTMWVGEKIESMTPAETNLDVYRFIELVTGFARESHIRPILTGALQSGQSGVLYNTAVQLAEKDFGPTLESLKHAAKGIGKRFLRSAAVITKDGDTIPIYHSENGTSYSLELSNKDTRGWDNLIQARISVAVPLNEQAQIATAKLATSSQPGSPAIMSVRTASTRYAGIEDRDYEQQAIDAERVSEAVITELVTLSIERALQLSQQPAVAQGALADRVAALDPSLQQAVQMHAERIGQAIPPNPLVSNSNRGQMNRVRTGNQQPSQTQATQQQVNTGGY